MRISHAGFLLAGLAVPAGLAAQASAPASLPPALPVLERHGAWACGPKALQDPDIGTLVSKARSQFREIRASLLPGSLVYLERSSRRYTSRGFFGPDPYWASDPPSETNEGRLASWPVPAPDPDSYPVSGFVANAAVTWSEGRWLGPVFSAPDPAFFLSAGFIGDYCFRAVASDIAPTLQWNFPAVPEGWIGLQFTPGPSAPRNAIKGVLWFDPDLVELEVVEWRYVNLPEWTGYEAGGGRIDFMAVTDGRRVPASWEVRTPVPTPIPNAGDVGRLQFGLAGYLLRSGHLAEIQDSSGATIAQFRYPTWETSR